jgi:hypothetical protein
VPGPDGGMMAMMYTCNLCKQGGGQGGNGDGGSGGNGGSAAGGDAGAAPPSKGSSGCSAGGSRTVTGRGGGVALVVAGIFGLMHARRRRRP